MRQMQRRPLLAGLAALAAPAPLSAQTAAPAGNEAEWRVGAVFPLSGSAALLGDEAARGLEMAVEAQNAAGTRPIRLIRADASEPAAALAEARRLIRQERVTLLFGSVVAQMGLAALQAAEALDVPFVELAAAADTMLAGGARRFIRTGPSALAYGRIAAEALTQCLPQPLNLPSAGLRVAVLHEASPSPEAIGAALEAKLTSAQIRVVERIGHAPRSTEWGAMVQRLRAAGANVLIHAANEGDASAMLRALAEAAWRPRVLMGAGPAWGLVDMARALEPALDGCFALDVPPIETAAGWAQGAAGFARSYQRRWGSPPRSGLSLAAYSGARIVLGQALERRAALRPALDAVDQPAGSLPNGWGWRLDERGQNTRAEPVLLQWQAGRAVTVFPYVAAAASPV